MRIIVWNLCETKKCNQASINLTINAKCKNVDKNTIIVENWDNWLRSVEQGPLKAKLKVLAPLE